MKVHYSGRSPRATRKPSSKIKTNIFNQRTTRRVGYKVKPKKQAQAFGQIALQLISLSVLICFGVLFAPNLLSQDTTRANAEAKKPELQIFTNFNDTADKTTTQTPAGNLIEYVPPVTSSSSQAQTSSLENSETEANTAATAPKPASSSPSKTYVVKAGDTLESISKKHKVDQIALAVKNDLKTSQIQVGQKLLIP